MNVFIALKIGIHVFISSFYVTENRYIKCAVLFFRWNIFHSLSYEQKILTNRIAGKLMNIKKIKLYNVIFVYLHDFKFKSKLLP